MKKRYNKLDFIKLLRDPTITVDKSRKFLVVRKWEGEKRKTITRLSLNYLDDLIEAARDVGRDDILAKLLVYKEEKSDEFIKSVVLGKLDKAKPLLSKLIERHSWFNNVINDVGIYVLFRLSEKGLISIDPSDYASVDDYVNVVAKCTQAIDSLIVSSQEAFRIKELEDENRILRAQLTFYRKAYNELEGAYNTAVAMLPPNRKKDFLLSILLRKTFVGVV
ncbi:MAG: hypothetical protein ACTSR0_04210 [Candidatus Asgardarchaeia archaeon]